jgi:hypothetical protein
MMMMVGGWTVAPSPAKVAAVAVGRGGNIALYLFAFQFVFGREIKMVDVLVIKQCWVGIVIYVTVVDVAFIRSHDDDELSVALFCTSCFGGPVLRVMFRLSAFSLFSHITLLNQPKPAGFSTSRTSPLQAHTHYCSTECLVRPSHVVYS